MITSIAEQLREALRRKGWSIKQAAEESNVDRSFLNRLIRGGEPPRTRSGRHTAEHDERYSRLAKALGLDVEVFIANARRVQLGTEEADLADRYPEFRSLLQARLPIRNEHDVMQLLRVALKDVAPRRAEKLFVKVSASLEVISRAATAASYPRTPDYLGLENPESRLLDQRRTRGNGLCVRIGDALVRIGDVETSRARVRLASLFYEIAPSVDEPPK